MASRTIPQVCLVLLFVLSVSVTEAQAEEPNYFRNVDAPSPMEAEKTVTLSTRPMDEKAVADSPAESEDLELFTERYPNRTIKIKRQVIQDEGYNYVNHGIWTQWNMDGHKASTGTYRLGKRHGKWTRWYFAADVKHMKVPIEKRFKTPFLSEANFVEGEIHGIWTISDDNGRHIASWEFDNGQLHGKVTLWYSNERKRLEATYNQGILDGQVRQWSRDGKLFSKRDFDNGKESDIHREFNKNGSIKVEGVIKRAKQLTKIDVDWWNAKVNIEVVGTVGNDERLGRWLYRYPDGENQLLITYVDNKPTGAMMGWYSNGQVSVQGKYVDGREDGKWTWWYENGQKKVEGTYDNGQQSSEWLQWDQDGKANYVASYSNGKIKQKVIAGGPDINGTDSVQQPADMHKLILNSPSSELVPDLKTTSGDRNGNTRRR